MHKLNKTQLKNPQITRLYNLERPIIGLTGSIATGKSTVSQYLSKKGLQIIDADHLVKEIYKTPKCINFIKKICPESLIGNKIDFKILREKFFSNHKIKSDIETFIYEQLPHQFLVEYKKLDFTQADFLIYDVPLLFEKGLKDLIDLTVVCYTTRPIQIERLMNRDALTKEQAEKIIISQISIEDKKGLADFVIDNSDNKQYLEVQIEKFLTNILY